MTRHAVGFIEKERGSGSTGAVEAALDEDESVNNYSQRDTYG